MSNELKADVLNHARTLGIDLVGVTTAEPFDRLLNELTHRAADYAGRYAYRVEKWRQMARPRDVLPDARAVLVLGYNYYTAETPPAEPHGRMGRIVTYGHLGILQRARAMRKFLRDRGFKAEMGLHRKEAAIRAGLGMVGKHNLVINPEFGSWVAYQSIVTDAPLEPDAPFTRDLCGSCDVCRAACPTGALYEPHRVKPGRCVTCLLTTRDVAPSDFEAMGANILGCDACQDACPQNRQAKPRPNAESLLPDGMGIHPPLHRLLELDERRFQREFIRPIHSRIAGDHLATRLLGIPWVQRLATQVIKTFMKGKEVLPETFVHASGNLEIYQRNAILAAGNLAVRELRPSVEAFLQHPYLAPYARWALERIPA